MTAAMPDPRVGRQRVLALYLRVALAVVLVVGTATVFVPDDVGDRLRPRRWSWC